MFGGLFNRKTNSNQTTTESNYADNRTVTDAGGGIVGSGNTQSSSYWADNSADLSQTTSNNWWDQSNRSQNFSDTSNRSSTWTDQSNRSNNFADSSNRSNTWTDASNRSTNDNSSRVFRGTDNSDRSITYDSRVTDGGAFGLVAGATEAQTAASKAIALRAFDSQDRNSIASINAAVAAQEAALQSANAATAAALGLAERNAAQAFQSSAAAIGFQNQGFAELSKLSKDIVQKATSQTEQAGAMARAAYKEATEQKDGNRTLIYTALAVVGLGAFFFMKAR